MARDLYKSHEPSRTIPGITSQHGLVTIILRVSLPSLLSEDIQFKKLQPDSINMRFAIVLAAAACFANTAFAFANANPIDVSEFEKRAPGDGKCRCRCHSGIAALCLADMRQETTGNLPYVKRRVSNVEEPAKRHVVNVADHEKRTPGDGKCELVFTVQMSWDGVVLTGSKKPPASCPMSRGESATWSEREHVQRQVLAICGRAVSIDTGRRREHGTGARGKTIRSFLTTMQIP